MKYSLALEVIVSQTCYKLHFTLEQINTLSNSLITLCYSAMNTYHCTVLGNGLANGQLFDLLPLMTKIPLSYANSQSTVSDYTTETTMG